MISDELRRTICDKQPCGGDRCLIRLYRDASGAVKKLSRLYGSCVHSPNIYFNPDGAQTELIANEPVVPGTPEARAVAVRHDAQIAGLTLSDVIRCNDGARLPPPRELERTPGGETHRD